MELLVDWTIASENFRERLTIIGGIIAVLDRGSTGWSMISFDSCTVSVRLASDCSFPTWLSARSRPTTVEKLGLWLGVLPLWGDAYYSIPDQLRLFSPNMDRKLWWQLRTAFGRWSIPTLKSHSRSLQSSPTLPKRYVRSSQRHGSNATPVTHDWWPSQRATIVLSENDQMLTRSSWPPVRIYLPSGDQQTHNSPP